MLLPYHNPQSNTYNIRITSCMDVGVGIHTFDSYFSQEIPNWFFVEVFIFLKPWALKQYMDIKSVKLDLLQKAYHHPDENYVVGDWSGATNDFASKYKATSEKLKKLKNAHRRTVLNILYGKPTNVLYRQGYVNKRLLNLNNKSHPVQPEVFLNESYCRVDHQADKSWGKKKDSDYYGNFNADKFEELFEDFCAALVPYGSCIIHIDGASYHKRAHGVKLEDIPCSSKSHSKAELLDAVRKVEVDTQFITHTIANKYRHKVMFTPSYHPESQSIEKV
ncbi:hypothetical protein K501DRAFT_268922 [Backusella circina FSU 941]|nr:hypothetical protein K501DRAFT_268922 [Backusella circina FSU 941]